MTPIAQRIRTAGVGADVIAGYGVVLRSGALKGAWFNSACFGVTGADSERFPGGISGGRRLARRGQLREKRV